MKVIDYKVVLASVVLALAGCSVTDDPAEIQDNNNKTDENVPISFGSYLGRANASRAKTRADGDATSTDANATAKLAQEGFGVFAYYTGTSKYAAEADASKTPNFMYNTKVYDSSAASKSSNFSWTYTPERYWPNPTRGTDGSTQDQYVSFFAYAPYTSVAPSTGATSKNTGITNLTSNSTTGDPTVTFTQDGTTDLLWGTAGTNGSTTTVNEDLTKQTINEKVTFHFKHALAELSGMTVDLMADQISGTSNSVSDSTRVTIKSITITPTTAASGTLNLATGEWSGLGTATAGTETSVNLKQELKEPSTSASLRETSGWATTMPAGVTTTAKDVEDNFTPITFIPNAANTTFNITIDYVVRTLDWQLAKGYTEVEQTVSSPVSFSTLEPNKRYTIRMHLGLTSVKFDAVVSTWEDGGESAVVDLPANNE